MAGRNRKKKTAVFGVLSIIFGTISLIPFLGLISVLGVLFGLVALIRREFITAIIGLVISAISVSLSPVLLMLVKCSINAEHCEQMSTKIESHIDTVIEQGEAIIKSVEEEATQAEPKTPAGDSTVEKAEDPQEALESDVPDEDNEEERNAEDEASQQEVIEDAEKTDMLEEESNAESVEDNNAAAPSESAAPDNKEVPEASDMNEENKTE